MKEFITKDKLKDKFSYKKTKNIKPEPVEKKEEAEKTISSINNDNQSLLINTTALKKVIE